MYTSSPAFRAEIRRGGEVAVKVEVIKAGTVIATTDGGLAVSLNASTVTVDRTATNRRSMALNLVNIDDNTSAVFNKDMVGPLSGNEIKIYRGLRVSGSIEYIPLGVFNVDEFVTDTSRDGTYFNIRGSDRSALAREHQLKVPYTVASSTNYATAIDALVRACIPQVVFTSFMDTVTDTTPRLVFGVEENLWEKAIELAAAVGKEVYFDQAGNLQLRSIPDPLVGSPVETFLTDEDGILVAPITSTLSRDTVRNGVIVRGSAPWLITPVYGEAWDDNPYSPTFRGGLLGELPEVVDNPIVLFNAQATVMAQEKLKNFLGIVEEIKFSSLVDPRLDAGDLVQVQNAQSGIEGVYLIDTLEIPLSYDATMSCTARKRSAG